MNSPKLTLSLLSPSQSQKHVTVNESFRRLDQLAQASVASRTTAAEPGSPSDGDAYILPSSPSGTDWDNFSEHSIAAYQDGAWIEITPKEGWRVWVADDNEFVVFDGSTWDHLSASASLTKLGVNTTADATNRLAVKTPSVLFHRETDDLNVTINKEAAADDARFTFQTAFSTRALLGLLGNDDFTVQVSPDGAQFFNALAIDKDTGNVAIGAGSDANNKFLVSGGSSLFTNNGTLSFTFSKGAAGDDCSLTFQNNFSSRALIGLLGNDDFTFKVSPNGAGFKTAVVIDKTSGAVDFSEHPKFSAFLNFGQNYTAGAWQDLLMNNTRHNDQADAAIASNVLTFTAPHDGYYMFGLGATYETTGGSAPTKMQIGLSVNSATPAADTIGTVGDAALVSQETQAQVTALLKLSKDDTVEPKIFFTTNDGRVLANENYFWGCQIG